LPRAAQIGLANPKEKEPRLPSAKEREAKERK